MGETKGAFSMVQAAVVAPISARRGDPRRVFVILSGYHDYRSMRRANLHFIADELRSHGSPYFFSIRYSRLTRFRDDPRRDLWRRSNQLENVNGVGCYLWRTPIHPMRLPRWLGVFERRMFAAFAEQLPSAIRETISRANIVFVESGMAIIYAPLLRRLNPQAQIVYMASDSLGAINQASAIKDAFQRDARFFESARVPSPYLRDDVPASIPCYFIPHGIDKSRFEGIGPSPYPQGTRNAVSVGSMLFDVASFEIAASLFPDITFHAIGSGHQRPNRSNLIYHREMPFAATLPFIKHSTLAIAPYGAGVEPYLAHTSMKLMQYDYLGLPAICPAVVTGEGRRRFGYQPGDSTSIQRAITAALAAGHGVGGSYLTWAEVTERLLNPQDFADTAVETSLNEPAPHAPS